MGQREKNKKNVGKKKGTRRRKRRRKTKKEQGKNKARKAYLSFKTRRQNYRDEQKLKRVS